MAAALVPLIPVAVDFAKDLIDRLFPDKQAQATERAAALQHVQDLAQQRWSQTLAASVQSDAQQADIAKIDAAGPWWKAIGRQAAIWVCVLAMLSDFVIRPYVNAFGHVQIPPLDSATLLTLFGALTGVATLRSLDKWRDKA
jgi:hypothetical protein